MRFSQILMAYFMIGAIMWGGGAIAWDQTGVSQFLIEDPIEGEANEQTTSDLEQLGGPINDVSGVLGGGLVAAWNIIAKLIGFLFWPIVASQSVGAPSRVVVLCAGLTVAFYGSVIRIVRGSA